MKKTTINAVVIKDFNDTTTNNSYEAGDHIENMPYGRFELLKSKGFVKEDTKEKEENKTE